MTPAAAIMRRHDVPDERYVVSAGDHPAVADLLEPGDCLATLITPDWAITAAHCAAYLPSPHVVTFGTTARSIDAVVCHPAYRGFDHDVALVRLSRPVLDVGPVPPHREQDEAGRLVSFVGRGDHGSGELGQAAATYDGRTRWATNVVESTDALWLEFVFDRPGDPRVTPLEGISADGDSGGPAFIDTPLGPRIAGISSWQDADEDRVGLYGVHDFYARISTELPFIDAITGGDWNGDARPCPPDPDEPGCRIGDWGSRAPLGAWLWFALVFGVGLRRRSR